MKRREFLGGLSVTTSLTLAGQALAQSPMVQNQQAPLLSLDRPRETKRGDMLYRQLGTTGEEVSLLGLGGHHVGRQKEESESIALIRSAIDAGINFLDNCWDYHDGGSEIRMGKALARGPSRAA